MAGLLKGLFGKKDDNVYYALVTARSGSSMNITLWLENPNYPERNRPEFIQMFTDDLYNPGVFLLVKYENGRAGIITDIDVDDMPYGVADILRGYSR